jgi:hypothetical protein
MHDQVTAQAGDGVNASRPDRLAKGAPAGGPTDELGQHPVAALTAAVLRMARRASRLDRAGFAERAGVSVHVVAAVEDGTPPAWALPYAEFTAMATTMSTRTPWMHGVFETAAACDLLLSCVLDGDHEFATDVLAGADTRELAVALLRWAIKGRLLEAPQLSLLRERAQALAASPSPDAWVGAQILAVWRGDQ